MQSDPQPEAGQHELLPGSVLSELRAELAQTKQQAPAGKSKKKAEPLAEDRPVARVLVDSPLAHLDRAFDYAVPASLADKAKPGVRVKVRFAGQDLDAFVLERVEHSDHEGRLAPLRRVVSPEPVLTPEIATLAQSLAERYAGTRADVLRLAIPPRHATAEREDLPSGQPPHPHDPGRSELLWAEHPGAADFFDRLAQGGAPRAVWGALPGAHWPAMIAAVVSEAAAAGRGVLVCVPDSHDVTLVDHALTEVLGAGQHVVLTADAGPALRYREFLRVLRGQSRVVVGTRSAAFAPVQDLGLVITWDDGDHAFVEPRAPYPHTREVLLTRAAQQGAAVLLGGFARSCEAQHLVGVGWASDLGGDRERLRARARPQAVEASDLAISTRLPRRALSAIRDGLAVGSVLVSTPRRGYAASLACERCRTPARCAACGGPLRLGAATQPPACAWCATEVPAWACSQCHHRGLRAPVVGDARTAEELGRTFPGVTVRTSSGERILGRIDDRPQIVVATPGAEPWPEQGYAAVVLLDTWASLARVELRTDEEALRRFLNAAGLVRPGGAVVAVGDPGSVVLQALVRWDPAGFADRENAVRSSAHLPPAARLATITGSSVAVQEALAVLKRPEGCELLGPVEAEDDQVRAVLRVPRRLGAELSGALQELQRQRSARKLLPIRVQIDPYSL